MSLPPPWNHVQVYATYIDLRGEPCSGKVIFTAPHAVLVDGVVVVPRQIVVPLDRDGRIDVMLPATVDPDIAPQGWTWLVDERITPRGRDKYRLALAAGSGPVNLDTAPILPPVPDPVDPTPYIGPQGPAGPQGPPGIFVGPWQYLETDAVNGLENGWTTIPTNPARWRIEGQSLRFGGVLLCGSATGAAAATLPEAYRPAVSLPVSVNRNAGGITALSVMSVAPTGALSFIQYVGTVSFLLSGATIELDI